MRYIIFGAGETGRRAYEYFDKYQVVFFVDNVNCNKKMFDKDVVDFPNLVRYVNENADVLVVIASDKYHLEMEKQLMAHQINNFMVFPKIRNMPHYSYFCNERIVPFSRFFQIYNIDEFQNIVIYGANSTLVCLLHDLDKHFQGDLSRVKAIVSENAMHTQEVLGIPIVGLESIPENTDCLLLNVDINASDIRNILDCDCYRFNVIDLYDFRDLEKEFYHPELAKYKDIHRGKRCFVIGSGPSLCTDDLNVLHENKEICFACNRIYTLYDKTDWRADYLALTDQVAINQYFRDRKKGADCIFVGDSYHVVDTNKKMHDVAYFHENYRLATPYMPKFSTDITRGCYASGTVLYDCCLQFAVYMGFTEIYLLGVDFSYADKWGDDKSHFPGYFSDEQKYEMARIFNQGYIYNKECELANHACGFCKAKSVAEYTGKFKIYNATRGGKLEIFERVNFDDLF